MEDSPKWANGDFASENVYKEVENKKNKSEDLIKMKSFSETSSDSGISDQPRRPTG